MLVLLLVLKLDKFKEVKEEQDENIFDKSVKESLKRILNICFPIFSNLYLLYSIILSSK